MGLIRRHHELTRLEGFSDAVFAFALTLLVVSLEVPHRFDELIAMMRGFLPFAVTFAMICWIWYEHQQFFGRYNLQDAWTITVNCFLMFVVLFYVYPLKFLTMYLLGPLTGIAHEAEPAAAGSNPGVTVMLLYSSGVVLIFAAFLALYRHAWRHRSALGLSARDELVMRGSMRGHVINVSLGMVSLVILVIARQVPVSWLPAAGGLIYSLMGPLHTWRGYRTGKALAAYDKKAATAPS